MANSAPTISTINAFNASIGTVIDFNIIGGEEIVRSNRLYIYDIANNALICSHLYVSTESLHEVPPNTDSSWVYASGKTSDDFTNGKQYSDKTGSAATARAVEKSNCSRYFESCAASSALI